jgi:hypothetical protein
MAVGVICEDDPSAVASGLEQLALRIFCNRALPRGISGTGPQRCILKASKITGQTSCVSREQLRGRIPRPDVHEHHEFTISGALGS